MTCPVCRDSVGFAKTTHQAWSKKLGCESDDLSDDEVTPDQPAIWLHESGIYVKLTQAATELFA
jgi:hypothetical protein